MHIQLLTAAFFVAMVTACTTHVQRTSLEKWETRSFKKVGLNIDLPKDLRGSDYFETKESLTASMHKIRHPWHNFTDDVPLAQIKIVQSTAAEIDDKRNRFQRHGLTEYLYEPGYYNPPKSESQKRANNRLMKELLDWHPNSKRIDGAYGMVYFRRDVKCSSGTVLVAKILWRSEVYPDPSSAKDDEAAFLRILESIKPMPAQQAAAPNP